MNIQQQQQQLTYMSLLSAKNNTDNKYYLIATVSSQDNTLAVVQKNGNGSTMFYCQVHEFVYVPNDGCDECRNAVVPEPIR